jgi:RND family efflux transporter MFP subunit
MYIHTTRTRWILVGALLLAGSAVLAVRGGARDPAAITEAPRRLAVTAIPVEPQSGYQRAERFVGRVEFAQASDLSFELGGQLARMLVDEGDTVEVGSVLAELDTARLRARRAELVASRTEAQARLDLTRLRDRRARQLLAEDVIAPQRADDARLETAASDAALARVSAQINTIDVDLAKATLRAPFAGEVAVRHVDAGVVVEAGRPVVRLLETAHAEARIGVARDVAAALTEGELVELRVQDARVTGRVLAVLPVRHSETRTVAVRIALDATDAPLRDGDLAELTWSKPVEVAGFWLPRAALTEGSRGLWAAYVAVPGSDSEHAIHRLDRRPIETLYQKGERVYVRGALRAGEIVVQDGSHRLVPGQLVQLASPPSSVAHLEIPR